MRFITQWLLVLLTVLNPILAGAALTDFDRQELAVKNWLAPYNSGFESSKAKWTASGGTLAAVTSGTNLLVGKGSATWDSGSAAQTLTSQTITIEKGYYGQNCEAGIVAQTPSGTATHTVQAYDGTNILVSATIVSSTTPRLNTVNFPCPQSGTVALRLVSVAADEPLIAIDDAYLGLARNVGSTQLISEWKSYTTTLSWTSGVGSYAAKSRRVGDSEEMFIYVPITGTPTTAIFTFTPPTTCVVDTAKLAAGTITNLEPLGTATLFDTSTSTRYLGGVTMGLASSTLRVITDVSTSHVTQAVPFTWANGDFLEIHATAPCVGYQAQTTASIDAISKRGSIYFASGSATNTGAVATFNVAGFGTNTLEGQALAPTTANDLGIRMTGAPAGVYEVTAVGKFYASSAATTGTRTVCEFRLYDGTNHSAGAYGIATGGGTYETNDSIANITGLFTLSSAGTINVVVRGQRVSGNGTCYAEAGAYISIKNVSQNSPAIILANSVSTGTANGDKIGRATIANSGSASITSQSTGFLSSVSYVSTGVVDTFFTAGYFSAAPSCTCTARLGGRLCAIENTAPPSTSGARFWTGAANTAAEANVEFQIICVGPR